MITLHVITPDGYTVQYDQLPGSGDPGDWLHQRRAIDKARRAVWMIPGQVAKLTDASGVFALELTGEASHVGFRQENLAARQEALFD